MARGWKGEGGHGGLLRGKGVERGGKGREKEREGGDVGPLCGKGVQGRGGRKGKEDWGTNPKP